MMFSFYSELNEIYFPQTREYFREVISSYEIENYRSSVVMLYSVVICDLILKLTELSDHYGDKCATSILSEINQKRSNKSLKNKSTWENDLTKKIYEETSLLDAYAYSNICSLYDCRNFSAHPAMNNEYKLIEPRRENVASCIRNALDDVLTKSPVFIGNVIDLLCEDLETRKDFYHGNPEQFEAFLKAKYFSKMNDNTVLSVFKALWKFVFRLNDEKCASNRTINRQALKILYQQNFLAINKYLEDKNSGDLEAVPDNYEHLVALLAACPPLFSYITETQKHELDSYVRKNGELQLICWYDKKPLKNHLEYLIDMQFDITAREGLYDALIRKSHSDGHIETLIDFSIEHYRKSSCFYDADHRFDYIVKPILNNYSKKQAQNLIKACSENRFVFKGAKTEEIKATIYEHFSKLLGDEFPFRNYSTFQFDYDTNPNENPSESPALDLPFDL